MPRSCSICSRPDRSEVDAAILDGTALRNIAERFGTTAQTLLRHRPHVPRAMAQAQEAAEVVRGDDLLGRLLDLNRETMSILREARAGVQVVGKDGQPVKVVDNELALKAIARAEKQIELQAELLGEINRGTTVNVLAMPAWTELQARLLRVLLPFPEARLAVAAALQEPRHG